MTDQITSNVQTKINMERSDWVKLGFITAAASIVAVLVVQALAIIIWPEIALFKPLDSYLRSAIFTLVPAVGATAVLAWLVKRKEKPIRCFIKVSAVVLIISIIPDYILPVPNKTVLASTVTAFLHVVAAVMIVGILVLGYRQRVN